jgi:alpha 1,3-glucosidase
MSGVVFCGADVGGFFGNPDAELLVRWYQLGAFQPFFRGHAHIDTKRREPWIFDEPYTSLIRQAIINRYQLLPYIYTLFRVASIKGTPIMRYFWNIYLSSRPMFVEFPSDEVAFSIGDQFMLGKALLIKPVVEAKQKNVEVYLPESVVIIICDNS